MDIGHFVDDVISMGLTCVVKSLREFQRILSAAKMGQL